MENPYAPPVTASLDAKPQSPTVLKIARLSWLLPLGCLAFTIIMNTTMRTVPMMGVVGGVVFIAGTAIGGVIALVMLPLSLKYRGVLPHALGGLVASLLLGVVIVGSFFALATARDAARRARSQPMERAAPTITP